MAEGGPDKPKVFPFPGNKIGKRTLAALNGGRDVIWIYGRDTDVRTARLELGEHGRAAHIATTRLHDGRILSYFGNTPRAVPFTWWPQPKGDWVATCRACGAVDDESWLWQLDGDDEPSGIMLVEVENLDTGTVTQEQRRWHCPRHGCHGAPQWQWQKRNLGHGRVT